MKNIIYSLLTSSFVSIKNEGKFARKLLWKHARSEIVYVTYSEIHEFVNKVVRIAVVGAFLSFFQEATVIELIKSNWTLILTVVVVYNILGRFISAIASISEEKNREYLQLQINNLIWQKNQSVGIGTRIGSPFQQKLRTAKRCGYYDIKSVGLWPIEAVSSVVSSCIFLGTLTFLNWRIGLIFTITAFLVSLVVSYMSRWLREKEKTLQEKEDMSYEYFPASLTVDSTFLNVGQMLFGRAVELKTWLMGEKIRFKKKATLVVTAVGTLTASAVAVQLWFARENLFNDFSLLKLGITISTVFMAVGSLTNTIRTLFGDQSAISDIREFQEFLEFPDTESGMNSRSFIMSGESSIHIKDVEFTYPYVENAPRVLRGINLELFPGDAVAIVGANGSGKTTLGHVLSNIYRPQKGIVEYGKTAIGGYTTRSVLEHVLVIPQKGDMHDLPICESLFGMMDMSKIDQPRYAKALAISGAREILDRLPNGIHTQIGTAFTSGVTLSGGEEQRFRLAAFFYKALDPSIRFVIADEPSRYLDPETRQKVYIQLIALARDCGKIVVVISHDADLERFDRIIQLDNGRVIGDYRGDNIAKAVQVISKRLAGDNAAIHPGFRDT